MNTPLKCGIPSSRAYADSSKFVNGLSGSSRLNTRMLTGETDWLRRYWCRVFYKETTQVYCFDLYIFTIYSILNNLQYNLQFTEMGYKSPPQLLPPSS